MLSVIRGSRQVFPVSSLASFTSSLQAFPHSSQSRGVSNPSSPLLSSSSSAGSSASSSSPLPASTAGLPSPHPSSSSALVPSTTTPAATPSSGFLGNSSTSYRSSSTFVSVLGGAAGTVPLPELDLQRKPSSSPAAALDFNDPKSAFEGQGTLQLFRALLVFKVSSFQTIVRHSRKLLQLSNSILGEKLTSFGLRNTFFGHFCAGEKEEEVHALVRKLKGMGVGSILDFAAEADLTKEGEASENLGHLYQDDAIQARVYEYEGEGQCDANLRTFLSCIQTASHHRDGFSAIKLTALGKPELLQKVTSILGDFKALFLSFAQVSEEDSFEFEGGISFPQFKDGLARLGFKVKEEQARTLFNQMDMDQTGMIKYQEWVESLEEVFLSSPLPLSPTSLDWRLSLPLKQLSEKEKGQLQLMRRRLERLVEKAQEAKVRVMVDAEQTYFQPAIDHLVLQAQRRFNKEFPVIYNTYQAYLRKAPTQVKKDLERARREGFIFGAKVVRGAYMVQERRLALEQGYADPICPTITKTHDNYDSIIKMILSSPQKTEVMVATHNEDSVKKTTQLMEQLQTSSAANSRVFFGQLLGMCDYVSFNLGKQGYGVYKYLPYGPVKEVIPYLLRRAEENCDILGRTTKERSILKKEISRRLFAS